VLATGELSVWFLATISGYEVIVVALAVVALVLLGVSARDDTRHRETRAPLSVFTDYSSVTRAVACRTSCSG
jgi:hypothetical protein